MTGSIVGDGVGATSWGDLRKKKLVVGALRLSQRMCIALAVKFVEKEAGSCRITAKSEDKRSFSGKQDKKTAKMPKKDG